MKRAYYSRSSRRHKPARSNDGAFFKKESGEPAFFDAQAATPFFSAPVLAPTIQRKCDKCEDDKMQSGVMGHEPAKKAQEMTAKKMEADKKEDKKLHRKETGAIDAGGASAAPLTGVAGAGGSGSTLPVSANNYFSQAMGYDFSSVKIHTGSDADVSAKAVNAKAYTVGNHIVFANGQYQPDSPEGKKLLAHELTHVVQQDSQGLSRKPDDTSLPVQAMELPEAEKPLPRLSTRGVSPFVPNKVAYGNCQGVSVQGLTKANYAKGTYSVSGASQTRAQNCNGCADDKCVTVSGTITSTFHASPSVSLPGVPPNKNPCEAKAIRSFINTTLSQHEQQHVSAFHTYDGTVSTPFTYTGCVTGWEAYVASIHAGIEAARIASANDLSDVLDADGANIFTITCECPDPPPVAKTTPKTTPKSGK